MKKSWVTVAPNGQFVNISGFGIAGRYNHGQEVFNAKLALQFPGIFFPNPDNKKVEEKTEEVPALMEEPAPTETLIDESPSVESLIDEKLPEVPLAEVVLTEVLPEKMTMEEEEGEKDKTTSRKKTSKKSKK